MKQYNLRFLIVFLSACFFFACQKELSPEGNINPPGPSQVSLPNTPISFSISGKVIDENNNAVAGATVSGGGKTTATGSDGTFRIENGNFNGSFATVKIEKDNYFTLVKTTASKSGQEQFITAKLSQKVLAGKIGVGGGAVTFNPGNIKVDFPANAFVTNSGSAVTDSVNVYITYIDPTSQDANERMPGNLTGVVAPSAIYVLRSLGMMAVELKNAANETVKIATDKKASITAPIPASLMASAEATIPLWYFDEAIGVWVKEGEAVKTGNTYKGEVSHFTFWNLDYFGPYCYFSARFLSRTNSAPLPYARLTLQMQGTNFEFTDHTDAGGYTYGYLPLNTVLQMKYYRTDGTVALDTLIGPYTGTTDLGNIYIEDSGAPGPVNFTIAGNIMNCAMERITEGAAISATIAGITYPGYLNVSGNLEIPVGSSYPVNTPVNISVYDSATNASLDTILFYNGQAVFPLPQLYVCNSVQDPQEFISYTLDGVDHMFIRNVDSVFCDETFVFNRSNIACRRANGTPDVEGYVVFLTGPSSLGGTDTSSILTLQQYSVSTTPSSLNIVSFTESYTSYPAALGTLGWLTGEFTCNFTDAQDSLHVVTSRFKLWRKP